MDRPSLKRILGTPSESTPADSTSCRCHHKHMHRPRQRTLLQAQGPIQHADFEVAWDSQTCTMLQVLFWQGTLQRMLGLDVDRALKVANAKLAPRAVLWQGNRQNCGDATCRMKCLTGIVPGARVGLSNAPSISHVQEGCSKASLFRSLPEPNKARKPQHRGKPCIQVLTGTGLSCWRVARENPSTNMSKDPVEFQLAHSSDRSACLPACIQI